MYVEDSLTQLCYLLLKRKPHGIILKNFSPGTSRHVLKRDKKVIILRTIIQSYWRSQKGYRQLFFRTSHYKASSRYTIFLPTVNHSRNSKPAWPMLKNLYAYEWHPRQIKWGMGPKWMDYATFMHGCQSVGGEGSMVHIGSRLAEEGPSGCGTNIPSSFANLHKMLSSRAFCAPCGGSSTT